MVQRYGDILDGKRTWPKELSFSNVKPTLPDAVAGDITAAMPYRTMTNIINFIKAGGLRSTRLRKPRDPSVLAGAEVLQQPHKDGRAFQY